jgi:peptidoglycan/xylan/chitin deacetylase (PgdA/CDA1 family)
VYSGSALSDGGNIGTYLAGWASNPLVEMTSHSHTHVSYSSNTLAWQKNDLKDGNDEMELVTGMSIL